MEALLARCVLPKLAMALRDMPINPANQVSEPILLTYSTNRTYSKLAMALREMPINPANQVCDVSEHILLI